MRKMRQISASGPVAFDIERAAKLEWLSTNSIGGFASGTVAGVNTRRYHAVLLAAPQMENRFVLVSQVQEEVRQDGASWFLGATYYPGVVHPQGYRHIVRFMAYPEPTWIYAAGTWVLEKRIVMVRRMNATVIRYRLLDGMGPLRLLLRPMLAGRNYHHTATEAPNRFTSEQQGAWLRVTGGAAVPDTWLSANGTYQGEAQWYRHVLYPQEQARGLDYTEDLYVPGWYDCTLNTGDLVWLVAWSATADTDQPPAKPVELVEPAFADVVLRHSELLDMAGNPAGIAANLVLAADSFIIERPDSASVIAGYPWFTDWGRDAMVSFPGLFLATGRSAEGLSVLTTFASAAQDGLIPNRFPDRSSEPEYNTVDASLWFIYACYKYLKYTGDSAGLADLWPVVKSIIHWYSNGTRFGIGADDQGLVHAGADGCQLTWMDAKVDGWVVTPRQGYPVEISALWYNALRSVAHLAALYEPHFGDECRVIAAQVKRHFMAAFWLADEGYLADVVRSDGSRDRSLRPNQLLAVCLPYPLVKGDAARSIVRRVQASLYTPMGLRSLAPDDPEYRGVYRGNQWDRDSAYHQGTVWAWLIGPFITAYRQAYGRAPHTRGVARTLLAPLLDHLWDAGLGHISEVFDGEPPHTPGGCFAQAWSVAEMLRLWVEEFDREPLEEIGKGRQVFHGY